MYKINFTPNINVNQINSANQPKTITYITNVTENQSYTTAMETTVHEDWICELVIFYNKV
jgi:hypothetical protein